MANKLKKWTKEEEDILVQAIQANPHNLSQCFKEVSEKIDRSIPGITYHWYAVLGNPENKKYVGVTFLMLSRKEMLKDRKICKVSATGYYSKVTPKSCKVTIWQKIRKLLNI